MTEPLIYSSQIYYTKSSSFFQFYSPIKYPNSNHTHVIPYYFQCEMNLPKDHTQNLHKYEPPKIGSICHHERRTSPICNNTRHASLISISTPSNYSRTLHANSRLNIWTLKSETIIRLLLLLTWPWLIWSSCIWMLPVEPFDNDCCPFYCSFRKKFKVWKIYSKFFSISFWTSYFLLYRSLGT
jgi:hypothetical protein